jgi:CRISPR system Cascade subunit CasA
MNLITDPWIPVIRRNGPDKIKPWQIAETDNPVMELNAPRPDFQGALYQFLIGLVQTCFAPEDEDEWLGKNAIAG